MGFIRMFTSISLLLTSAVALATPPAEGRWTLRAGGRPILLLELRKDSASKGGWTGSLTRPKHFEASSNFMIFSKVEGPAGTEVVVDASAQSDSLKLTIKDSDSELTHLLWTPSDSGGSLRYIDFLFAVDLTPAANDELVSEAWDKSRTYSAMPDWPTNAEMARIFEADQAVRQDWPPADPGAVIKEDQARRARTNALLDAGQLRSGTDFYHAALIFQHGDEPQDFLLAHTLAVVATARGRSDATWIAAATLDRYLQAIGQKQVYGTQFTMPNGKPSTQEPYDRKLISDALREALSVPPIAQQEKQRAEYDAEKSKR
jgi:hypothetical protein